MNSKAKLWPDLKRLGWELGIIRPTGDEGAKVFLERIRADAAPVNFEVLRSAGFEFPEDHGRAGYRLETTNTRIRVDLLESWITGFERERDMTTAPPRVLAAEMRDELRYADETEFPLLSDIESVDTELQLSSVEMEESEFNRAAERRTIIVTAESVIEDLESAVRNIAPYLTERAVGAVAESALQAIRAHGSTLHAIDRVGGTIFNPMLRFAPEGWPPGDKLASWKAIRLFAQHSGLPIEREANALDPTTSEGYARVIHDPDLQLHYQDRLDDFLQRRIRAVRNVLRAKGWEGGHDNPQLTKSENGIPFRQWIDFTQVGAGANVVGWRLSVAKGTDSTCIVEMQDDLTKSPEEIAALVESAIAIATPEFTETGESLPVSRRVRREIRRNEDRIDDAGEKIGGARKDFYRQALAVEDLDNMTLTERAELVTLQNIWPFSIKALKERGVPPGVVRYLLDFRRAINSLDTRKLSEDKLRKIVFTLSVFNQHLAAGVHDAASLQSAFNAVVAEVEQTEGFASISNYIGWKAERFLQEEQKLERSNGEWAYKPAGTPSLYDRKYRRVDQDQESMDRMWAKLLPARQQHRDKETGPQEPERPHLDSLRFIGPGGNDIEAGFRNGVDIVPETLLKVFGFRGVEFGNWLPQDERQRVINYAYDGLMMLAHTMNLPPQFMSLNGTLALAFGARGVGRFAAHYEPGRKVANLTRLRGAGSLAHEFFHALDDYLATARPVSGFQWLTEAFEAHGQRGFKAEQGGRQINIWSRVADVMGRLSTVPLPEAEIRLAAEHRKNQGLDYSQSWCRWPLIDRLMQNGMTRERATLETEGILGDLYDRAVQNATLIHAESGTFVPNQAAAFVIDTLREKYGLKLDKKRRTQIELNLRDMSRAVATLWTLNQPDGVDKQTIVDAACKPSQFIIEARKLDNGKSKGYWATAKELAARGFECFIFDRMQEAEYCADYLVHGVEADRYADAAAYKGNPYPAGSERVAINQAFERLIDVMRDELKLGVFDRPRLEDFQPASEAAPFRKPGGKFAMSL